MTVGVNQAYAEEFNIEFPEHVVFIKNEAVIVNAFGVIFDSRNTATVNILDNVGTLMDSVNFQIERTIDIGDYGWLRIETDNSKYQTGTLYTILATYQGQESQLQFTLTEPPPTVEELANSIQTQQQDTDSELELLRVENAELRNQIINLTERIDGLMLIIQEQINVMMTTIANLRN